jgi:hypothetical protein
MMPNNESMVETQKVLDAEVEKRIDELNKSAYWEWQSVGEGSKWHIHIHIMSSVFIRF